MRNRTTKLIPVWNEQIKQQSIEIGVIPTDEELFDLENEEVKFINKDSVLYMDKETHEDKLFYDEIINQMLLHAEIAAGGINSSPSKRSKMYAVIRNSLYSLVVIANSKDKKEFKPFCGPKEELCLSSYDIPYDLPF